MKKLLAALLAVIMVLSLTACGGNNDTTKAPEADTTKAAEDTTKAPEPDTTKAAEVTTEAPAADYSKIKIGFIFLHDPASSTYDNNFYQAALEVQKELGLSDDQVIFEWNVPEGPACYETAADMADKGCNIVVADSFGHESYIIQAAQEFPDVQFCHATGTQSKVKNMSNYHNAFASIYEGRYLAGIAAGEKLNEMINAGKITADKAVIGYIGAFTYAEVVSGLTSFFLGARSVCPSATMKVRYTGSWYDQGKEQEAAIALIDNDKCVLISQHADSLGAPVACEERGVPNVSYNGSTYSSGKTTWLVSSAINWAPYFKYIIESTVQGKAFDTDWCGTIATNSVVLSGLNQDVVTANTEKAIKDAITKLNNGTLHVFDTSTWTVGGKHLTEYLADVDGDYTGETNVIHDGYFDESNAKDFRSAPYFDIIIDGIENLNTAF